ncbi:MAG TPA: hypothetical protein P5294_00400 [Smithellaceae bacterium]|nr:hypothetical protein [Smithellaceae bacterium]HRS88322.1 hypothetical protein [Smithellaceae bacterium]HRV24967.1 hypothetical protein [Smithellaceae bacterium]
MDSTSREDKKIFELTDVLEEANSQNNQEVIVIDGRGYERDTKPEVVSDQIDASPQIMEERLNEEIIRVAQEAAEKTALEIMPDIIEKITREMVPSIAEKIIREEIEKLKKLSANK